MFIVVALHITKGGRGPPYSNVTLLCSLWKSRPSKRSTVHTDLPLNENDADSACMLFIEKFVKSLDNHQPMRELSKKEKKLLGKPWLTAGLLKSISKKRALFKKFKNDKLKNKDSDTYQQYKLYTTQINRLKKICMKESVEKPKARFENT